MTPHDRPATYTYAITRPFDRDRIAGLRGVDDGIVHMVRHQAVAAVVSSVPAGAVAEPALRARLEDLDELEALARAHHHVVETVATHAVTIPFRLATIHHDDGRVVEILRDGHSRFDAALVRVAGRVELGTKVYAQPAEVPPSPSCTVGPESASPGRDYLRRRRNETERRQDTLRQAEASAQHIDERLADLAVECRHHCPQHPQLSGVAGTNVLNAAYLVDEERVEQFIGLAAELDADLGSVAVVVTGPWAPYSFAVQPGEAER